MGSAIPVVLPSQFRCNCGNDVGEAEGPNNRLSATAAPLLVYSVTDTLSARIHNKNNIKSNNFILSFCS